MKENKTVLVTGCAGFIGSHLSERLLREGNNVIGIDNFDPFYSRKMKEQNMSTFFDHPKFTFKEIDLLNPAFGDFIKVKVDVVAHLAGKAGVRPSIEQPREYIGANITATQNILDFMIDEGIRDLVFASSSSVYGNALNVPFNEEADMSKPISPYAFTKRACELLTHTFHHLNDLNVLNLRFFTVYGPRQRPDLAIHKFVDLISQGKEIPVFGDGSTARDYTFVDNTVDGVMKAIAFIENQEKCYEIINLGNNEPVKLNVLIETIGEVLDKKPIIKRLAMQPGDVDITFADISKARRLLDYNPDKILKDGIVDFVEWYNNK